MDLKSIFGQPGLIYYVHESGATQFERPSSRSTEDPLGEKLELERRKAEEEEKKDLEKLPERAVRQGEARVWHILKKHRDFFGKPAKSWRQSAITWSKKEAGDVFQVIPFQENILINRSYTNRFAVLE